MSEDEGQRDKGTEGQGPSLVLVYGLIVLFFLVAATCAALIVLPFYHRH